MIRRAAAAQPQVSKHRQQRGVTLIGLLFWAVLIGSASLLALKVVPSLNEYFTIQRAINKIASSNPGSVAEVRRAFESQQIIEYSITSITAKDLEITKENEKVVISFGYDKEIELIDPVFLVIKFRGRSQ
jgi:hypothetical protein